MTTIAQLQSILGGGTQTGPSSASGTAADAQDRFLKLLVTQMQNQDPLNPMDNAEVTTQLAQLNTVTGIEQLNKTLSQLAASSAAQQSLQAASLVGREVLVAGSTIDYRGAPVRFGLDLAAAADSVTISITDAQGNPVETVQAGAQPAGMTTFQWDGLDASGNALPSGKYMVSASARAGGAAVGATPLAEAAVQSVGTGTDGSVQLQLSNGSAAGVADVKRFL